MTRSLRNDESGFTLIEILVSALILGLVSVYVLNALDGSTRASGLSRARGAAASLAQQDQERLRAMSFSTLASVNSSRTANVCGNGTSGCVSYTVTSKSDWVADTSTAATTCALSGSRSYNLQITSTVTWPNRPSGTPAAVEKSLVAAPPGTSGTGLGSLAVRIRQADGVTPDPGITVNLSGPGNPPPKVTDVNGCAVWDYLASGTGYNVSFSESGYWDQNGNQNVARAVAVVGQRQTTQNFTYSPGANVDFAFRAYVGGLPYGALADRVTLMKSGGPTVVYGTNNSYVTPVHAANLVPGSGYTAYAGECTAESQTTSPGLATLPTLQAGILSTVTVTMPGLNIIFKNKGKTTYGVSGRPTVKITKTGVSGCPNASFTQQPTYGSGRLQYPGVPKGTYSVCSQAYVYVGATSSKNGTYRQINSVNVSGMDNRGYPTSTLTMDVTEADTKLPC